MSRPKLFVSCDWDFFIYNGANDQISLRHPETGEWSMQPGLYVFDWGQGESFPKDIQYIQWLHRMQGFDRLGLRMEDVATIRPDLGCTHPLKFVEELNKRLNFESCPTLYSDSHALGHNAAALASIRANGPVDLLLFDAHHDLGYSTIEVGRNEDNQVMDCGDWVYHSMRCGMIRNVRVVFPDWLGLRDRPIINEGSHLRDMRGRVACTTWSKWCQSTEGQKVKPVAGLHLARSSGWTPPYMDRAFNQFVDQIGSRPKICMDCEKEFASVGHWDACQERTWFR